MKKQNMSKYFLQQISFQSVDIWNKKLLNTTPIRCLVIRTAQPFREKTEGPPVFRIFKCTARSITLITCGTELLRYSTLRQTRVLGHGTFPQIFQWKSVYKNPGESRYVVLEICFHPRLGAIWVFCFSNLGIQYGTRSREIV